VTIRVTSAPSLGDCPFGELALLNVRRLSARRVRLAGLAEPTLAGAPVEIVEGGLVIARTAIRSNGSFEVRCRCQRAAAVASCATRHGSAR